MKMAIFYLRLGESIQQYTTIFTKERTKCNEKSIKHANICAHKAVFVASSGMSVLLMVAFAKGHRYSSGRMSALRG